MKERSSSIPRSQENDRLRLAPAAPRFVNQSDAPNVAFRKGWVVTSEEVAAGTELVARYNASFWGRSVSGL